MTRATASLQFLGAIDTVTGSRYLVERGDARVLIDCGLFQGPKKLRARNWSPPPFDVESLSAVVLTHAHIDHTGYLPRLCKAGYAGPVYCSRGTRDLLQLLLPDSGHLQEEAARHANRWGYSRHQPAQPLYTRAEAERSLEQLVAIDFHEWFEPAIGFKARLRRAGHILGAATIALDLGGTTITFSGDVGRPNDPIMNPPEPLAATDYLVVESTYGDRRHATDDPAEALAKVINEALARGGALVVPAFAVGRAQHLLYLIATLRAAGKIPACPVYLDSPMAIDATELFCRHLGDHRLSAEACARMQGIAVCTQTPDESRAIDVQRGPLIVISAAGMCTGGRILHHLARFLPDERSTVLFVGYQASGTRGRTLMEGSDELKLLGGYVPVRATIAHLDGLSAHADQAELCAWLDASALSPRRVFVTHGEPSASDAMRRRLFERFGWDAIVPEAGQVVLLE